MAMTRRNSFHQFGFALVILIWILGLLSLMAASFTQTIRREIIISNGLKTNATALAIAETWVMISGFMLTHPNPQQRWLGNGTIYQVNINSAEVRIRAFSEEGKIDINTAKDDLLHAVINYAVKDLRQQNALFDAIADWRDADQEPHRFGAEASQYAKMGLTDQPSNQPFQSLDELQLVLGMDEDIFSSLQGLVTVYAEKTEVDYSLASEEVLKAILQEYQNKNIHDIELENSFNNRQNNRVSKNELTEKFGIFTVTVETRMDDDSAASIETVIKIQDQQTNMILDWRYGRKNQSLFDDVFLNQVILVENEFTNNH
ncbi:MAG: general secretion pathway protein GspK [Methylomonas sp.]